MAGAFIVTGAGRGLGATIAEHAFRAGYPVVLISRTESDLQSLSKKIIEIEAHRASEVSYHVVDLTDEQAVKRIFGAIQKKYPNPRALINNAGTWTGGITFDRVSREVMQKSLDLNFYSAFNSIKALLEIRSAKDELSIINIGATASLRANAHMVPFAIAKAALRYLSQGLAKELGFQGIHVAHLVIDGLIDNERTRRLNPERTQDKYLSMDSIAQEVIRVALQSRDCWTFEWDVRPFNEKW